MLVIYGRKDCTWCRRAVTLAVQNETPYSYRHYSEYAGEDNFPWKTVPQIFLVYEDEETHIGGYDELKEWYEDTGLPW